MTPARLLAWLDRHRPGEGAGAAIGALLLTGLSLLPGGVAGCLCGGALNPASAALLGGVLGANLLAKRRSP